MKVSLGRIGEVEGVNKLSPGAHCNNIAGLLHFFTTNPMNL